MTITLLAGCGPIEKEATDDDVEVTGPTRTATPTDSSTPVDEMDVALHVKTTAEDSREIEDLISTLNLLEFQVQADKEISRSTLDLLRPHLTDKYFDSRLEGLNKRDEDEDSDPLKIKQAALTQYDAGQWARVSVCYDAEGYDSYSSDDPDDSTFIATPDGLPMDHTAYRVDGTWVFDGMYLSDFTCDDLGDSDNVRDVS